jgi:hypothetical protein
MGFENVKIGDEVYGTIYGQGTVCTVFDKESFYTFEVEYIKNGVRVHYTPEGIPNWGKIGLQTVFYKQDIDLLQYDFEPSEKVLKPKDILKLKLTDELEIRCPSGIWRPINQCPLELYEEYVWNERFHLFRKLKKKQKVRNNNDTH